MSCALILLALAAPRAIPTAKPVTPRPTGPAATAKAYCEAWKSGNFAQMKNLFDASRRPSLQEGSFQALHGRGVRCSGLPGALLTEGTVYSVSLPMTSNSTAASLYLTAGRQIAFDPILIPHPGVVIGRAIRLLTSSNPVERAAGEAVLVNRSIPLQGYSAQDEEARRNAAAAKLSQWWKDSGGALGTGFPLSPEDRAFTEK